MDGHVSFGSHVPGRLHTPSRHLTVEDALNGYCSQAAVKRAEITVSLSPTQNLLKGLQRGLTPGSGQKPAGGTSPVITNLKKSRHFRRMEGRILEGAGNKSPQVARAARAASRR
jgi:hypothetical protein